MDNLQGEAVPIATDTAHQRFLVNVTSNVVYILAQVAFTLWLTPYLVGYLGMAAFGMIPLVTTLTSYMAVLTTALNSALSRFLAIDLGRADNLAANSTFNAALFGLGGIILVLTPMVLSVALAFPTLFQVPSGWEKDASCLFAIAAFAFFVTVIGSNFAVSPFVHSRFLLSNLANLAGLFARIGFIVTLFSVFQARLWYVGGGILVGALTTLVGYLVLWRKLTPQLSICIRAFDLSRLKSLMGMGGWLFVNMLGAMLLARVDLIVVNAYFGAAITGGYGSVVQFSLLMEYLVSAASTTIRPVFLVKYAQGDVTGLQRISSQAVKLLGLALALPIGLLCGFSRSILAVWLGPSYDYLSILLVALVFHQSLNLCVRPLLEVQNTLNKVRWPGIATLLCGGASLGLALLFARWGKWGAVGVALAVAAAWTAKNAFFMPIYTARILKLPWWFYLPTLKASVIGTLFVWIASYCLALVQVPDSWLTLAASSAVVSLVYVLAVWKIGLSRADRELLNNLSLMRTT